jgi:hypothetical protein
VNTVWTLFKTHTWSVVIAVTLLGIVGQGAWAWWKRPARAETKQETKQEPPPRESVIDSHVQQRDDLQAQKRDAALVQSLKQQVASLTQDLSQSRQEGGKVKEELRRTIREEVSAGMRKLEETAQARNAREEEQRRQAELRRQQDAARREKDEDDRRARAATEAAHKSKETARPSAGFQPQVKLTITPAEKWDGAARRTANPQGGETAHLLTGCHAESVVLTGVEPSARAGGSMDIMFFVKREFRCPWMVRGPGLTPRETAVPIQGCVIYGHASGDLATSRVHARLEQLACVMPDKRAFIAPIKGYATDIDGNFGIFGTVKHHASAQEAKIFLAGLMQEASALLSAARSTIVVTPYGGGSGPQPFQGAQTTLQQLGTLYVQQVEYLLPTLFVPVNTPAHTMITEGTDLPGLPVNQLVTEGR